MTNRLIIFSIYPLERLDYVLRFVFFHLAGIEYRVVNDLSEINTSDWVINYSDLEFPEGGFQILPDGSLSSGEKPAIPDSSLNWREPGSLPETLDVFSFIFFHLSRVDEFDPDVMDEHDRVLARNTWLGKQDLLQVPVVDMIVERWFKLFNQKFQTDHFVVRMNYKPSVTIDVDQLYAYRRKPLHRWLGSLMRDILKGRLNRVWQRLKVLRGGKDPYDLLNEMILGSRANNLDVKIFFLISGLSRFDRQIGLRSEDFEKLGEEVEIGLHPSYLSTQNPVQFHREKKTLEELTGREIISSRFHYLRLKVPVSYQLLCQEGITHDYTLSWSDEIGFRAGTCHSFQYYDLEREATTELWIHPIIAMDVVLKNTLRLDPQRAVDQVNHLIDKCRAFRGEATIIWHNSSFDKTEDWSGWEKVFERILANMATK
ncbi:MAG: polysaccharide deacetylase family protein [Saprospiraceae bacterium]|nr:polysaccharide deacetylase family protein [Saprospiraceae bacterium]